MTLLRNALSAIMPQSIPDQRAIWVDDSGHFERPWDLEGLTPEQRRRLTSNPEMVRTFSSIFAAVRKRTSMATKATIHLMRSTPDGAEEVFDHPALDAIRNVNQSLTTKQGQGLIEMHKLTAGKAFWVKRRSPRLRVPVEFEIWNPANVAVVGRKDKPWVPQEFRLYKDLTNYTAVAPEDVVWFRHLIDPVNVLDALSPIGAVRVQAETGLEALRYNQRFFDNNAMPSALIGVEGGAAEVTRIKRELEKNFQGTDRAHRMMVVESNEKMAPVAFPMAHKDMEFVLQIRMAREEVGAVFELSPVLLGDTSQATKENLEGYELAAWQVEMTQQALTMEELNEFYLWPDFDPDRNLYFEARFDDVAILAGDELRQAQIDQIYLNSGKVFINELRERDGEDPVAWGDEPRSGASMGSPPPGGGDAPEPPPEPPRSFSRGLLEDLEADQQVAWAQRFRKEMRAIIRHLEEKANEPGRTWITEDDFIGIPVSAQRAMIDEQRSRAFEAEDVDSYNWQWAERYGAEVEVELSGIYEAFLQEAGYIDTLEPTVQLAVRYAQQRGASLLTLQGPVNIVNLTRERVRKLVADAIANGDSLQTLQRQLRQDFAFSRSRAETVSRTETATAQGQAKVQAFQSRGVQGKRWVTAGDERVDAFGESKPCINNENAGVIPLNDPFPSGHTTVPAHPRCRCTILPVRELPQA